MTNESFSKLTYNELKEITRVGARIANRRIENLSKKGEDYYSPAYWTRREKTGGEGFFNPERMNLNTLRTEFTNIYNFLAAPTSTITGANRAMRKSIAGLKKVGINITPKQFANFWKSYNKLKERNPGLSEKGFKYHILEHIDELQTDMPNVPVDEIVKEINNDLTGIYETYAEQEAEAERLGFYEIENSDDDLPEGWF